MKKNILLLLGLISTQVMAQNTMVLKGDEWFGNMNARQIGPAVMSGRVSDLEGHPTNPRVIYAGTAGGGVWKSEDAGTTWNSIFDKHIQSIGAVALDPQSPDKTVWVGTGECWTRNSVSMGNGIYRSTDGGQNFTFMGLPNSEHIASIIVHPKNSNVVYVAVQGKLWGPSEDRGVYKTEDAGKTWQKIFYVNENTGCSDLTIDPTNPEVMYAAFWEHRRLAYAFNSGGLSSGLHKSTDGGKTWTKIQNGFPTGRLGRVGVAVAPSNPKILYAVLETEKPEDKGLYRSENAGASWIKVNGDFELTVRPFYFSRIVVDPKNPDMIYKAGLSGSISRDGGKTFKTIGSVHSDIHDFYINTNNSDAVMVATDGGIYKSYDGANTFTHVKGLPVSQFYQVSVDNAKPYNVYGGLQDNQSWYGPSASPGGIENSDWKSVGVGDGFRVYKHPTKPITYSEMQGAENIWRYDIEKQQVKIIKPYQEEGDPKLRFNWNAAMNVSKINPDRIYVGSQFLHKSDDMGNSWTKISPDLTTNDPAKLQQENSGGLSMDNSGAENHCTIFAVAESTLDQNIIWVGTDDGNVQVTFDGGKNWKNVTANIPNLPKNTWVHYIEPGHFDKNTAYATFDGHNNSDFNTYVYKTTDGGATWKSIATADIKAFARHIREDLVNPNLLFLGTEQGLYITVDGGQNWSQFKNNFPNVAVHYLEIHPREHDLIAGTHGRGVIVVDDISPLRQLTADVLAKDLHIFDAKPTIFSDKSAFTEGTGDAGDFVGPNPKNNVKIPYYMKSRHTFGKMNIEILDKAGKVITELPASKAKGINIVEWSGEYKLPKIAKAKTFSFGGFTAPKVPAGSYTVKITKGNQVFTKDISIEYDATSGISLADREVRFENVMKLYNMNEQLAYEVHKMDMLIDSTTAYLAKYPKMKKDLQPILTELTSLKETMVVTKGDNYVGSAEPQLREKMSGLYSEMIESQSKPTGGQMANLKVIEKRFADAKAVLANVNNSKWPVALKKLAKMGVTKFEYPSFEDFKAKAK